MQSIEEMITAFCNEKLNDDYKSLCLRALFALNTSRGKPQMWAAAIVYAIAQNNHLIGNHYDLVYGTPKYPLTPDLVADYFGVSKGAMFTKAKMIRETLRIEPEKEIWMSQERKNNETRKSLNHIGQMLGMMRKK